MSGGRYSKPAGEKNTASNVGGGAGVYKDKDGVDLRFKSLEAVDPISISVSPNTLSVFSIGGAGDTSPKSRWVPASAFEPFPGSTTVFKDVVACSGVGTAFPTIRFNGDVIGTIQDRAGACIASPLDWDYNGKYCMAIFGYWTQLTTPFNSDTSFAAAVGAVSNDETLCDSPSGGGIIDQCVGSRRLVITGPWIEDPTMGSPGRGLGDLLVLRFYRGTDANTAPIHLLGLMVYFNTLGNLAKIECPE